MRPSLLPRFLAAGAVMVIALAGAACGDDDDSDVGSPTTTVTSTTAVAPATSTSTTTPVTTTATALITVPTTAPAPPPLCSEPQSWNLQPEDNPTMSPDTLFAVRIGRHDCYDRVVFDVRGAISGAGIVGYNVSYVDGDVLADASGQPVPTAGAASLQIVIRAPASGYHPDRQYEPLLARVGDDLYSADQLRSWSAFRQIAFAGSFEGQSTFTLGLDTQLPFRVGAFERNGRTHIYVDVAHAS